MASQRSICGGGVWGAWRG